MSEESAEFDQEIKKDWEERRERFEEQIVHIRINIHPFKTTKTFNQRLKPLF